MLIVDIAVPRNVDPELGKLRNVVLYNIDDLNRLVDRHIQQRVAELPKARAIVLEELGQFRRWLNSRQLAPTIQLLQRHFHDLRQAEIRRFGRQFNGQGQAVEALTHSLCNKLLHQPMKFLNGLPEDEMSSQTLQSVDLIRRLFDLDALEAEDSGHDLAP